MKKIDNHIHIEPLPPRPIEPLEIAGKSLSAVELLELLLRIRHQSEEDLPVIA